MIYVLFFLFIFCVCCYLAKYEDMQNRLAARSGFWSTKEQYVA